MTFGESLQVWRERGGITQEQLADELEVTRQAVAKWESNRSMPDAARLLALADALGVSADALLRGPQPCAAPRVPGDASPHGLAGFLLRATAHTYAAHGAESAPSRPGSHDFHYVEEPLGYIDSYVGGWRFGGEEAVFREEQALWVMNYCGRALDERFSGDFLKEALLLRPLDAPFRGPRFHQRGEYVYHNRYDGDLSWFAGEEEILFGGERVYECRYHGGLTHG